MKADNSDMVAPSQDPEKCETMATPTMLRKTKTSFITVKLSDACRPKTPPNTRTNREDDEVMRFTEDTVE